MEIKVQNKQLDGMILFLTDLHVKGKASLGRTKLKKKLQNKQELYGEDQVDIIDIYATWTDKDSGQFQWKPEKVEEGKEVLKELKEREVEINLFDHAAYVSELREVILEFDEELSGQKADAWEELLEAFESIEDNKEENNG